MAQKSESGADGTAPLPGRTGRAKMCLRRVLAKLEWLAPSRAAGARARGPGLWAPPALVQAVCD
jgi:hypothetical protein